MYSVIFRLFLKVSSFSFLLFFLVFHFVLWYRYQSKVWFVKSDNFVILRKRSDKEETVIVNWKKFNFFSSKLVLYNLNKWCYKINYKHRFYVICVNSNNFIDLPLLSVEKIGNFTGKIIKTCDILPILSYWDVDKVRKLKCNDFVFIKYNNKLFVCSSNESKCNFLTTFDWYILWYTDLGLVFIDKGKLYTLILK